MSKPAPSIAQRLYTAYCLAVFGTLGMSALILNLFVTNLRTRRHVVGVFSRAFLRLTLPRAECGARGAGSSELEAIGEALTASTMTYRAASAPPAGLEEMPLAIWSALVERALGAIARGELAKVVLARRSRLCAAREIAVADVIERLAEAQPGGARFAMQQGEGVFLGASPERLVTLRGQVAEMDALAGSAPRTAGSDGASVLALLASTKDRAEHRHVIEGIRAALAPLGARVSEAGDPSVRTLRTVHHLWTPLRAELEGPAHALDLVDALHPTPAVCGAPREAARAWIAENEPAPRGCYAGPVGWCDGAGDGSFWVGIRSAVVRANEAWLFAGAGLVDGSDPGLEYEETGAKQDAVLSSLRAWP